jgi:carbonic anhydrase
MADEEQPEPNTMVRGISRRRAVGYAGCAAVGFASGWLVRGRSRGSRAVEAIPAKTPEKPPATAQQALERLREGNRRFVEGKVRHGHENRTWREALVAEQHPFAVVLGCSDSRVPIELVFDQGFGDLFVIRVAGNVIATDVIGSIAYALAHLHTRLLVVLGHEGCGAVSAALKAQAAGGEPKHVEALLRLIGPGLRDLPPQLQGAAQWSAAVEANVRWSMGQLAAIPAGREILESGRLTMVGAVYELASGQVRYLASEGESSAAGGRGVAAHVMNS